MAAKAVDRLPAGPSWSYQPKYDGFRALAFRDGDGDGDGDGVALQSRQQRALTTAFPDVAATVAQLDDVVIDGVISSP